MNPSVAAQLANAAVSFILFFLLAMATEGIMENLGEPVPTKYKRWVATGLAILLCVLWDADLLAVLGYPAKVPYAGAVLTGFIIGRGSNYLNWFLTKRYTLPNVAANVALINNTPPATSEQSRVSGGGSSG